MKNELKHKLLEENHKRDRHFMKIDNNCFAYADDELEIKTVVIKGKEAVKGNGIVWWGGIHKYDTPLPSFTSRSIYGSIINFFNDEAYSVEEFMDVEGEDNCKARIIYLDYDGRITRIREEDNI